MQFEHFTLFTQSVSLAMDRWKKRGRTIEVRSKGLLSCCIVATLLHMARNWEEFDDPGTARSSAMHVSLAPNGKVQLSRNAFEALGKPGHVTMLWETDTSTIGIRPVPPNIINAFKIYDAQRAGARRLHVKRFLDKHDIRLECTVRFPTARIEDGILVLELKYRVRSPRAVRSVPKRAGWKVKH